MTPAARRTTTIAATAIAFLIGFLVIARGILRSPDATPMGAGSAGPSVVDAAAIEAIRSAPQVRALVPLAPPVAPSALGNANPFKDRGVGSMEQPALRSLGEGGGAGSR